MHPSLRHCHDGLTGLAASQVEASAAACTSLTDEHSLHSVAQHHHSCMTLRAIRTEYDSLVFFLHSTYLLGPGTVMATYISLGVHQTNCTLMFISYMYAVVTLLTQCGHHEKVISLRLKPQAGEAACTSLPSTVCHSLRAAHAACLSHTLQQPSSRHRGDNEHSLATWQCSLGARETSTT